MPRKKMEETETLNMQDIMDDNELPLKEVPKPEVKAAPANPVKYKQDTGELVNCLRNERIIVRYIPKATGIWGTNPKHVLAGGMAEGSVRTFTVPRLSSGMFVNILTDNEKAFLEEVMGLEYNALSIYKKTDNFWDDSNEGGINRVRLTKRDTYLDLSSPEDYIRYKILLANKNSIAPSLQELTDKPKATYQFVIISEGDETKSARSNLSITMQCYKEFGKIEDDFDTLRTIIETLDGRPLGANTKIEFLQTKANEHIQANGKMFLKIVQDSLLPVKVLIKKCMDAGLIISRGHYLYLASDGSPLCEDGEEPTITFAAKYLSSPKRQAVKFALEAKLK